MPDCVLDVRRTCASGDVSVLEWTFRGTHTGDLPGLPARGAALTLNGVSVCLMAGDLIAEEHVYFDAATLLAAAGVLPG